MKTFVAICQDKSFSGGWLQSMNWAVECVRYDLSSVVKVLAVRAGERQGRVVAEFTDDGIRMISDGRCIPLRKLRKAMHGNKV